MSWNPSTRWTVYLVSAVALVALLALPMAVSAQEHPEHPQGSHQKPEINKDTLAAAIQAHVKKVAAEHGGLYPLTDPKTGKNLELELVKVHKERLSETAPDVYFACTDFKATDGNLYDIDFFMKGKTPDGLEYQDFSVHKVNGQPRYTWYEEGGVWKKKPVDEGM